AFLRLVHRAARRERHQGGQRQYTCQGTSHGNILSIGEQRGRYQTAPLVHLALHDPATDFTFLHEPASTSGFCGAALSGGHSAASAFLSHCESLLSLYGEWVLVRAAGIVRRDGRRRTTNGLESPNAIGGSLPRALRRPGSSRSPAPARRAAEAGGGAV